MEITGEETIVKSVMVKRNHTKKSVFGVTHPNRTTILEKGPDFQRKAIVYCIMVWVHAQYYIENCPYVATKEDKSCIHTSCYS